MKLKLMAAVFAICTFAILPVSAKTIYVDVNSKSPTQDGSAENPFEKIQAAADIAEPGDTVLVNPGVYYESVTLRKSGTKEKPIIFKAVKNGEYDTVITAANRQIREGNVVWKCEDEDLQLYSIPYPRNTSSVLYNGARMLGYTSLEELKSFECWSGAREDSETTEGYPHGFYWDEREKKLYVHIGENDKYGSQNPNQNLMCIGGPYYEKATVNGVVDDGYRKGAISTDSYNFGIVTEDSANVLLSGFTFETPGWCGVFVRANDVTVRDCWFRGCMSGVTGGRYTMHDTFVSENVTVENSDWNLWPTFEDAMDKVRQPEQKFPYRYYWWCTKATLRSLMDYESGAFCQQAGRNWTIRNNMIASCLDAMSWAMSDGYYVKVEQTNINKENADGVKIYGNRFERCLDNAIEFENHAKNIDVYDNEFVNIFLPISWQPLGGTPWPTNIKVHHNVFYDEQWMIDLFLEKANYPLEWLKFGASASQWATAYSMRGEALESGVPVRPIIMQDKGFWVYNNSVYIPKGYTSEVVGLLTGKDQDYNNSYVFNNLIYCRAQTEDQPFRTYIKPGEFVPRDKNGQGWMHRNNLFIPSNPGEVELVKESETGKSYESFEEAGITMDGMVWKLDADSKARGAGVQIEGEIRDTTDIGPVPYGERWDIRFGVFKTGDVNSDRKVDLEDVAYLSERIGTSAADENYSYRCDLDFNGVINENDLQLLGGEYFAEN